MKSRENIPDMIKNVYNDRKQIWNINTTEDLERLALDSDRELFFYLTYAYIANLDLSNILSQDSIILRYGVSIYVEQAEKLGFTEICDYLRQYMVVNESAEQAYKVLHEITMAEEREKRKL